MKMITVFYIFNYTNEIDNKFIEDYLRIFLRYKYSKSIEKYVIINMLNIKTTFDSKKDIIQNGFDILKSIQTKIQSLKQSEPFNNSDFILIYCGNGSIFNKDKILYGNADILLLNNNVDFNNLYYTINTNIKNILIKDTRECKFNKIKIFRTTLEKLFELNNDNILKYS